MKTIIMKWIHLFWSLLDHFILEGDSQELRLLKKMGVIVILLGSFNTLSLGWFVASFDHPLESWGEPGKINLSKETYLRVRERIPCHYRGKFQVKNRGELDMYFIEEAEEKEG